ncbi:hypothetical protein ACHHYP_03030 [Achlya hypogyna]|uniref:Uncharacterized protein n=1 Tax=Achlya hypogyna TaxID=1202772 RepID=A0A1V9Z4S4_ACHHY|nr:hypothetical protein ACHHYP_03030 [Achlya hypogyna]
MDWAARVIQGHARGFIQRAATRRQRNAARRDQVRARAAKMYELVVDEVIRTELVPDLLIDILTSPSATYEPPPGLERAAYATWGEVLDSVLRVLLTDVVHGTIQRLVQDFLRSSGTTVDPMDTLVESLLLDLLRPTLRELVHEDAVIDDLVQTYLVDTEAEAIYEALLRSELHDAAAVAREQVTLDGIWAALCDDTLPSLLTTAATSEINRAREANAIALAERDRRLIADASTSILNHAVLQGLLALLAQHADRIVFTDACEHLLSLGLLRRLIERQTHVEEALDRSSRVVMDARNHIVQQHLFSLLTAQLLLGLDEHEAAIQAAEETEP